MVTEATALGSLFVEVVQMLGSAQRISRHDTRPNNERAVTPARPASNK